MLGRDKKWERLPFVGPFLVFLAFQWYFSWLFSQVIAFVKLAKPYLVCKQVVAFFFFFSCKHSSFQLHGLKVNFILPPILMPSFACFVVFVLKIGKIFSHVSSGV